MKKLIFISAIFFALQIKAQQKPNIILVMTDDEG